MKKTLDFICIGAPKSATSTLFELLKDHSQIYVPPAKEVPYFNDEEIYRKGWEWYLKTFFQDVKANDIVGTMTPQYMTGIGHNTPEVIAERIQRQLPNVRIVALLRHPITRSYSHYKMHQRNGYVNQPFIDAANRLLTAKSLAKERNNLSPKNQFLFASEYGRILNSYYQKFPKKNILVLYTDDFEADPAAVLKKLLNFLKVDDSYQPTDISRHSHQGGQAKVKYLAPAYLDKLKPVNFLWKKLIPARTRKNIFMKITRWNIKPDHTTIDPKSKIYQQLVEFFKPEVRQLEELTGQKSPWSDWH